MENKSRKISLLGILLIIIVIFKPISRIIMFFVMSGGNLRSLWFNWYPMAKGFGGYPFIENALANLYSITPTHQICQIRFIGILIASVRTYIPVLCNLALLISGIGFFFRKNIFRQIAIIALSILLVLGVSELVLSMVYAGKFYIDSLIYLILFVWVIYYLTRPKIKE